MKLNKSILREKIMTILYQIYIYRKDSIDYKDEEVKKENIEIENEYANNIIDGVLNKEKDLDDIINKYMNNWTVNRLGNIDQAIFRMSAYELLYSDTPKIVSINEGIELSKKFSDEKVTKLLNGVLDKIYENEVSNEWSIKCYWYKFIFKRIIY